MKKRDSVINLFISLIFVSMASATLVGCETDEDNKLASAQECFNKISDSDSNAAAQACEDKLSGVFSSQAYVLRCAVQFFIGGVKSSNMITAFDNYKNASDNLKTAALMDALTQAPQAQAEKTYENCMKSGVKSLQFIAATSLTGSLVNALGGGANFTDNLTNCDAGGAGGLCDDETIGTAVMTMYDIYCVGEATEESVCTEIRSAKVAGNNDPAQVAIALYNLIGS